MRTCVFDHGSAFHHELHILQDTNVCKGISVNRNQIGELARFNSPNAVCCKLHSTYLASSRFLARSRCGELAEWLMAPVLKTGIRETVSGVRIPHSPPRSLFRVPRPGSCLSTGRDHTSHSKFDFL
jgi:hypothetical protein